MKLEIIPLHLYTTFPLSILAETPCSMSLWASQSFRGLCTTHKLQYLASSCKQGITTNNLNLMLSL